MSQPELPPLPPDVGRLLDVERTLEPADGAFRDAVWKRVERAILIPPTGGGGDLAGGGGTAGSSIGSAMATGAAASATRTIAIVGAAAFAAGGITGGLVTRQWLAPAPLVVAVDAPPPMVATAMAAPTPTIASIQASELPPSIAITAQPIPASAEGASPAPAASTALDRERELLDVAKSALRRRLAEVALDAIDRHGSQFPAGQLREEREALRVQALVLAGRRDEASVKAAEFKKDYEDSLLLPSVEQSVASGAGP
jgi:hypothetical protein